MTGSGPEFKEEDVVGGPESEAEPSSGPETDDDDDDRESEEPPAPAPVGPRPDEDRWGIGSRVLAISALLGSAISGERNHAHCSAVAHERRLFHK